MIMAKIIFQSMAALVAVILTKHSLMNAIKPAALTIVAINEVNTLGAPS